MIDVVALQILLTGQLLNATRARVLGLVNEVVPWADLRDAAQRMARTIVANAPLSVRAAKAMVYAAAERGVTAVDEADRIGQPVYLEEDAQEGPRAFERAPAAAAWPVRPTCESEGGMTDTNRPVRIANCSGFYGDRLAAPREMLDGPDPIDVLTGDYLAELTMLILWKARQKDPDAGYASTFLRQMEEVLGTCLERGVKVVTNAGGLTPRAWRPAWVRLAGRARSPPEDRRGRRRRHHRPARRPAGLRPRPRPCSTPASPSPRPAIKPVTPTPTSVAGASPPPSPAAPTSSSARGSPTPRSSPGRPPGGTAGTARTGTASPGRWSPATSSSAVPRPPEATTHCSTSSPTTGIPGSRSPRSPTTAHRSSPSSPAPAAPSPSAR